jgi:hypothetical protein
MRSRRVPVVAAVLAATVALVALAAAAARETLVVPAGQKLLTKTVFEIDQNTGDPLPVTMSVSGSVTYPDSYAVGGVKKLDAFYCFSGCQKIETAAGLLLGVDRGADTELDSLADFVKGNTSGHFVATPKYDPSHRYTFAFACDENASFVCGRTWISAAGSDAKATGSFTVQIGGPEDTSQPSCRGSRGLRLGPAADITCKLDRVVFLEGTKFFRPAAESRESTIGQYVYFRAAVTGHTLPLDLLLLFPKEVGKDGISVEKENDTVNEKKADVDCGRPAFNAKRGQFYLLCKVASTSPSGAIVRVEVPKALRGKQLEVVLAAIRRKPGQSAPDVLDKATAGIDLDVEVSAPKAGPAAPVNDPIEGHWQEVKLGGSRLTPAFPDADIRITRARDERGALKEDLWVGRGGGVELFLNRPDNETRVYDGSASGSATVTEPIQLQLLVPGAHPIFPFCVIMGPADETRLCGWWVKEPPCLPCGTPIAGTPSRIVVLRRVSD